MKKSKARAAGAGRARSHPSAVSRGSRLPVVALTSGEPAGIGPDISLAVGRKKFPARLILVGDRELLRERSQRLGMRLGLEDYVPGNPPARGVISVLHCPAAAPVRPGTLNPSNSRYVLAIIDAALRGCVQGRFDAMVTAPVHKGAINDAGIAFTGHTEYLAQHTSTRRVVMLLVGGDLRVALATTHLALKDVPAAITGETVCETLRILHRGLKERFGVKDPRILVAGLNPHAGESGYLGSEEINVIAPALDAMRAQGINITGPLPADSLFTQKHLRHADCVLVMYHDQGLPVLKYASFGKGVNLTLGLPFIRTSVDHGTALELAATGGADSGSLEAAVDLAIELAKRKLHSG